MLEVTWALTAGSVKQFLVHSNQLTFSISDGASEGVSEFTAPNSGSTCTVGCPYALRRVAWAPTFR